MTIVSINTPNACTSPICAGHSQAAAAAAHGADPDPASFENNPRFTPFIRTAPNPPAATCLSPKASLKILAKTAGILVIFVTITKIVIRKYTTAMIGTTISNTFTVAFFLNTITAAMITKMIVV